MLIFYTAPNHVTLELLRKTLLGQTLYIVDFFVSNIFFVEISAMIYGKSLTNIFFFWKVIVPASRGKHSKTEKY